MLSLIGHLVSITADGVETPSSLFFCVAVTDTTLFAVSIDFNTNLYEFDIMDPSFHVTGIAPGGNEQELLTELIKQEQRHLEKYPSARHILIKYLLEQARLFAADFPE